MDVEGVDFGSHGIIYVTQEKEKPTATEWTNPATEKLLKILSKHYEMHAEDGKFGSKRILYANCSLAMKKKGFKYTAAQCENKWKSLKRRYLTAYKRSISGKGKKRTPYKRQMFDDEIEFILQFVQPEFKKNPDPNSTSASLFNDDMDQDDEENNESDDQKYIPTDDEQLVQRMLKGSDDEDQKDNILTEKSQYVSQKPPKLSEVSSETPTPNNLLVNEVRDLTKAMKSNVKANTDLLRSHGASYEQILVCLDSLDRKADERIEIERKELELKKIQNSLLAKIVQKLGNITNN